nr:reverse transcriptase domain-containing protein [Tanacetum cinerariifolium]
MRTRRSYFPPTSTIPRHSRKQTTNVVELEIRTIVEMADNRTMAQMLQAPIEGYEDKPNKTFNVAWERFKDLLRQCPHHGFSKLHQLDTFYNALNLNDQDALDSAARGNFLDMIPREGIDFESEDIENFLNDDSIPFGVKDSPFNMDEDILFLENFSFLSTFLRKKESGGNMQITLTEWSVESDPRQEEIDIVSITNDVLPPSIDNDDSDDEEVDVVDVLRVDNFIQNSEHEYFESEDSDFDIPPLPLPPPEPPDKGFDFEIKISIVKSAIVKFECIDARIKFDVFNDENDVLSYFMFKEFSFLSAESEDTIFDPGISD